MHKKLSTLLKGVEYIKNNHPVDLVIKNITSNSKQATNGTLFVAIPGVSVDGHTFISQAIDQGAVAVVGEAPLSTLKIPSNIAYIQVTKSRQAYSILFSNWYGNPASKMSITGITGTDGKTSTSVLLYSILRAANIKTGLISTVFAKVIDESFDVGLHVTSPDASVTQRLLYKMKKAGCTHVVLEVTSHALDQDRFYGIKFSIGLLTNFTPEHLDYHKTMNAYAKSKAKMFQSIPLAILGSGNIDNKLIISLVKKNSRKVTTAEVESLPDSIQNSIYARYYEKYNQQNAALAATAALALKVSPKTIASAVASFPPIPGRLEEIKNKKGMIILVDFAHTPNSFRQVFKSLKEKYPSQRLIVVFGCAGERDNLKRPKMGRIASNFADVIVLTAEDPRSEDVTKIISDINQGLKKSYEGAVYKVSDRRSAIKRTLTSIAQKGDVIVFCGKGHEKSINVKGVEYEWDEKKVIKEALQ